MLKRLFKIVSGLSRLWYYIYWLLYVIYKLAEAVEAIRACVKAFREPEEDKTPPESKAC